MSFLNNVRSRIFGGAVDDLSVQDANVNDELAAAGRAFGTLMQRVGSAVAETQQRLDSHGAAIAEEMCNAEVDMIRARETVYDSETGKVEDIVVRTGKGRLIELASPVFYEYQYLTLQGEFTAKELASSTQNKERKAGAGGDTQTRSNRTIAERLRNRLRGGATSSSIQASASFSDTTSGDTFDSSVGTIRMNALIAPKSSVVIPKPPLILVGPPIAITEGDSAVAGNGDRSKVVTITVTKRELAMDGKEVFVPNADKELAIDAGEAEWSGSAKTNVAGKVFLTLVRKQTPDQPPLASKQVPVTVRLGLVNATATVRV